MTIRNGMPASELPEVTWRKSRRSGPQGGNCVEVAHLPGGQVAVRNSRHPAGPTLVFTSAEWAAFVGRQGRRVRLTHSPFGRVRYLHAARRAACDKSGHIVNMSIKEFLRELWVSERCLRSKKARGVPDVN
jgi:hypothetical protein